MVMVESYDLGVVHLKPLATVLNLLIMRSWNTEMMPFQPVSGRKKVLHQKIHSGWTTCMCLLQKTHK